MDKTEKFSLAPLFAAKTDAEREAAAKDVENFLSINDRRPQHGERQTA